MPRKLPVYNSLQPRGFIPPIGRKPVFLPKFTVTLLRTPDLPPTMAKFIVPLNLNKLDLKDYLYHAYNIPVLAVRSYIILQRLIEGTPKRFIPRRWHRPRSIKHMIVEMEDPFVWPEEEKDLNAWDKEAYSALQKGQKEANEITIFGPMAPRKDQDIISQQAKALLGGKETWKPTWMQLKGSDSRHRVAAKG